MTIKPDLEAAVGREYRKTATIRAVQFLGQHVAGVCTGGQTCKSRGAPENAVPHIHTLEGDLTVSHGDWIATGVQGEHWAIKPDVFAASYEEVSDLSLVLEGVRGSLPASPSVPTCDAAPILRSVLAFLEELWFPEDAGLSDNDSHRLAQIKTRLPEVIDQVADALATTAAPSDADAHRASSDGGSGWLDIASAPKDGALIDVWVLGSRMTDVKWSMETPNGFSDAVEGPGWVVGDYDVSGTFYWGLIGATPTHWMPLPPAPGATGDLAVAIKALERAERTLRSISTSDAFVSPVKKGRETDAEVQKDERVEMLLSAASKAADATAEALRTLTEKEA